MLATFIKNWLELISFLPLGLMVVQNIKQIVREEMMSLGTNELLATSLQSKELWQRTDRWDDEKVDVWSSQRCKREGKLGLAGVTRNRSPI